MNQLKRSLSLLLAAAQILIIRPAIAQMDPAKGRIAPPVAARRTTPGSAADSTPSRLRDTLFLQPVEVRALRAGERAPFTKTDIGKAQIEKTNLGQDLPFLLNQTPSVVISSDAGNGVGYTNIHIRGTDATRINMTLNGIPYNDAESQGIYFVDLPDLASSVGSIQIQRGVGTSSNGAGAFGATMNFSTNEYNEKSYGESNNSYGSFNTWKNTVKVGSGLIDGHFTIDARLSRISSDGYIDRASSDLRSFYLSAAWLSKSSSLRFNILSGKEKTYQAWNGIPEAKLTGDKAALDNHYANNLGSLYFTEADSLNLYNSGRRTYNYFTYNNQTDNYQQDHYQLFFNHAVNQEFSFNTAAFLTRGRGYFEEYRTQDPYSSYGLPDYTLGGDTLTTTNLVRQQWLDNYFYGGIFSLQYKQRQTQATLGGGWDRYDGKHYGNVIWSQAGNIPKDYQYYNLPAHKTDLNIYGKWQQQLSAHLSAFADLQLRHVSYDLEGFQDNPTLFINKRFDFFNPKAGLTWSGHEWQAYFSWSKASHEPNRDDFEAGISQLPKPETLNDFEWGFEKKTLRYSYGATVYYMVYKDQLALTGQINKVGGYTRTNIPDSYRLGLELQGSSRITDWLTVMGNLAFSRNKEKNYTEYIDDYDNGGQKSFTYKHPDIAFSPAIVGAASLNFYPCANYEISLPAKYVGKQYLDNAQKEDRRLDGYYVQDLRMSYTIKAPAIRAIDLVFQLNNVLNKKYQANGYTYGYFYGGSLVTENFYFPMAGTNFLFAVNIKL
ncbi:MAG TPA: TonB-dependent receptor plug domain-containing protein [Puia sp.]|nr:TonB-dependent receptor plug domain-containing protein [Puia sp.]